MKIYSEKEMITVKLTGAITQTLQGALHLLYQNGFVVGKLSDYEQTVLAQEPLTYCIMVDLTGNTDPRFVQPTELDKE